MSKFIVWVNSPSASNVVNSDTLYSDYQATTGFASGTAASSSRVNSMLRQSSLVLAAILKSLNFDLSNMPFDLSSTIDTATSNISNTNLFKINECLRYSTTGSNNIDTIDTDKPYVRIGSVTTKKFGFSGIFNGDAYLTSLQAYDNNINVCNSLIPQSSSVNIGSTSSKWPYIYATNVYSTYFIAQSYISSPKIVSGNVLIENDKIKIANRFVALYAHNISVMVYDSSDNLKGSICISLLTQSSTAFTTWEEVAEQISDYYPTNAYRCSATGYLDIYLVIGVTRYSNTAVNLIAIPMSNLPNMTERTVHFDATSHTRYTVSDRVLPFFG